MKGFLRTVADESPGQLGQGDQNEHAERKQDRADQDVVAEIAGAEFVDALKGHLGRQGASQPGEDQGAAPTRVLPRSTV